MVLTEPLPTKRALFGCKGSLSFRQHGLLMTSNKNDHGNGGSEGQDEQPDANRSGNSMYRGAEHISADPEKRHQGRKPPKMSTSIEYTQRCGVIENKGRAVAPCLPSLADRPPGRNICAYGSSIIGGPIEARDAHLSFDFFLVFSPFVFLLGADGL